MPQDRTPVIVGAARTAIGNFGGTLWIGVPNKRKKSLVYNNCPWNSRYIRFSNVLHRFRGLSTLIRKDYIIRK
jgi:hypothetical protein